MDISNVAMTKKVVWREAARRYRAYLNCNRGIGNLRDSPEVLRAAIVYIENEGF